MPGQFAGELVAFSGRLLTMTRKRAAALVVHLGGTVEPDPGPGTTLIIAGAEAAESAPGNEGETDRRRRRHDQDARKVSPRARVVSEDEFCERAGTVTPSTLRREYYAHGTIRGLYTAVQDVHLRYLEKWGLLRSVVRTPGETWYGFGDLALIKQANEELARGGSVKAVLRTLAAAREGQLALDFQPRGEGQARRVVRLRVKDDRPSVADAPGASASAQVDFDAAERFFNEASAIDSGEPTARPYAMAAYRRALSLAPQLVPALVNLGNLHYADDHFAEAQALYLQAALTDPGCFEAHFNLGNLLHDLGRFAEAADCYREALRLEPEFADAHFYLAVALEKQGRSSEARPHWRRYQELAPDGEWVELAREFVE